MNPGFLTAILACLFLISPFGVSGNFPVTLVLLIYVVGLFFYFLNALVTDRVVLNRAPKAVALFIVLAILLIFWRAQDLESVKHLAQFVLGVGVIYLFASQISTPEQAKVQIHNLLKATIVCFYLAYAISALAYFAGHPINNYMLPWESNMRDARGGLLGSSQLAATMGALTVIASCYFLYERPRPFRIRLFLIVTLLVAGHAIIASATRSAFFALLSVPFLMFAYRGKLPPALLSIGAFLIIISISLLLFLPQEAFKVISTPLTELGQMIGIRLTNAELKGADILLTGRAVLWRGLLQMVESHPFAGLGKDLPYTEYGILIVDHPSSGQVAMAAGKTLLGGNDSGFSLVARHGIPFSFLFFLVLFRPLLSIRDPHLKVLAHQTIGAMLVFWLVNGSYQFLYLPDASFVVLVAALASYAWNQQCSAQPDASPHTSV